jgi:phosphoribosylanthranilate isomerase
MQVKICGITTLDDALIAADAGADMLGFNFWPKSKRYIAKEDAAELCSALRAELTADCPLLVGVFVNMVVSDVSRTMEVVGLDFAQLAGDESEAMLRELRGTAFKAIRPANAYQAQDDLNYFGPVMPANEWMPSILLDASVPGQYGGTGQTAADEVVHIVKAGVPRLMLAGGLTPENVAERVAAVQPWGVDVASGVEGDTPGRKDANKVREFIWAARA